MSILVSINNFQRIFDYTITLSEELFGVSKDELLSKSSKRKITDIKKIITYKFYNLKRHDKDNMVNLLSNKFLCGHSNVVYWYNKAKELYSIDSNFYNNYNLFSNNLDSYIIKNKIS